MRIVTLLARHGTGKYPGAAEAVAALLAKNLPGTTRDLVVIDNSLPAGHSQALAEGGALIGGSNAAWEFSAWDSGIGWLGSRITDYDLVHLVTSAFAALPGRFPERCNPGMLSRIAGRTAAVGHIDFYHYPVTILGQRSRCWLRSSFIFLPPAVLMRLGSLVSIRDRSGLFSGDPAAPFRADAPLSKRYRRYILDWLTGAGTGQEIVWHSRFTLSQDSLPLFEDKATAILNEHLLSIRLRALGCTLVDGTWLDTRHRQLGAAQLGGIPSWSRQLAERDTDAVRAASFLRRIIAPLKGMLGLKSNRSSG